MPEPAEPKIDAGLPPAAGPLHAAPVDHAARRMVALLGAAIAAGFEAGAISYVLPAMRAATGASAQLASWLLSVFVAATLVAVPLAALAVRRIGATRLLRGCLVLAVVAGGLASVLPSPDGVLVARALQGLAHGPLLPLVAAVIVTHWPPPQHGRLLGQVSMAYGLTYVVATIGTPWLLQFGWRSAFSFGACLALLSLAWPLPASAASHDGERPAPWWLAFSRPMLPAILLALGTGAGQSALVWMPTVAATRLGLGMTATAPLMVPLLLGGLIATACVIRWLDRLGSRPLVIAGLASAVAGVLLVVAAPAGPGFFMAGGAALGFGIGMLSGGPLRYAAARALPRDAQGLAQGAVAWLTDVGLLAGSVVVGHIAGRGTDARSALEAALSVVGVLMLLCAPAIFRLPRQHGAAP
ncbi:Predicted arabinose efflux permease, MFS family [Variovorax sp. HW608]|uniref:MFS transporter n=1 Tax=Variovorax sp. HW608 TaxID=1034889 RepID=UPI00081FB328|nr:MFS transporter [Variovorax sp. HW608]SCK22373.1 Predicted arabinose efflux permease, MFS family [Variovorax sp. HW608]